MAMVSIYSIKDTAVQKFMPAFTAPNDASATRAVRNILNKPGSELAFQPEDYELYLIGFYDDDSGVCWGPKPDHEFGAIPALVARCKDLVAVKL